MNTLLAPDLDNYKNRHLRTLAKAHELCQTTAIEAANKRVSQFEKRAREPYISIGDLVLIKNYIPDPSGTPKFRLFWKDVARVIGLADNHVSVKRINDPWAAPKVLHVNQVKRFHPPPGFPIVTMADETEDDIDDTPAETTHNNESPVTDNTNETDTQPAQQQQHDNDQQQPDTTNVRRSTRQPKHRSIYDPSTGRAYDTMDT
jgi:hypothetical protein